MSYRFKIFAMLAIAAVLLLAPSPRQDGSGLFLGAGAALAGDDDDDGGGRTGKSRKFSKKGFSPTQIIRSPLCICPPFVGALCPCKRRFRSASRKAPVKRPAPYEIIATGLTDADAEKLRLGGFRVVRQYESGLLGTRVSRLIPPKGRALERALRDAAALAPGAAFGRNDLYTRSQRQYRLAGAPCGDACETFRLVSWSPKAGVCSKGFRIGVIDTGVDLSHPAFERGNVEVAILRSPDRAAARADHGTAVVSLLAGSAGAEFTGMAPDAQILVAEAFHLANGVETADVYDVVAALDWLTAEQVKVINISFSGPDNAVLRAAILKAQASGAVIVAAAGLPDNANKTGYPGRYRNVIAVGAVDIRLRPSRLSARGEHLDFTAPGVGLIVAASGGGYRLVDGTSFAAPLVSAAYAIGLNAGVNEPALTEILARSARDLGPSGHDELYGWGLLQFTGLPCR